MTGRMEALRGKGRRVMRSRLVHEWRGVTAGGWYFVPFQTRRKPRRQDFGVRLKSCRLNLRSPGQFSPLYTAIPPSSFPASYSFSDSHPSCGGCRQLSPWPVFCHGKARHGKSSELLPFSTFILAVEPWNVYGTRKLTAAKSKDRCRIFGGSRAFFSREDCGKRRV